MVGIYIYMYIYMYVCMYIHVDIQKDIMGTDGIVLGTYYIISYIDWLFDIDLIPLSFVTVCYGINGPRSWMICRTYSKTW